MLTAQFTSTIHLSAPACHSGLHDAMKADLKTHKMIRISLYCGVTYESGIFNYSREFTYLMKFSVDHRFIIDIKVYAVDLLLSIIRSVFRVDVY